MPTIRQLKRRIQSVKNTAKITNALQLVAASKMRRAQDRAGQLAQRNCVLAGWPAVGDAILHPPREAPRAQHRPACTPDRGLCGGLNANMNRSAGTFVAMQHEPVSVVAVGKKGRDFFIRAHTHVIAEFTELGDYPTQSDTLGISRVIMDDYLNGTVDRVYVSFPELVSTANQRPTIRQLLPIEPPQMDSVDAAAEFRQGYIFEPSPDVVLQRLLPRYIEMQIYEAILQNAASFQSAQMVAMKNATDSAKDITKELTLTYNKARQEQITKELLDIVGGAAALEK
jgi:F-type H+-transporting ATPase subunit gamma